MEPGSPGTLPPCGQSPDRFEDKRHSPASGLATSPPGLGILAKMDMSLGLKSAGMFCFVLFLFYFWLSWVFIAVHVGFLELQTGSYSLFAMCRLLTEVASLAAVHGLGSCGTQAWFP